MYCHTEQRRTQRFYIVEIVRHRGTVGVWSIRGYLRVLLMFLSTSLQSSGFTRFLKTFITKVISNTYTTALSLFVPSAPPWYCLLCFSSPCSPPLCVPFICSRLTLSLHISKDSDFWSCCHCCHTLGGRNVLRKSWFIQMLKVTANKK